MTPPQNFFGVGGGVPIFTQSLLVRVPHSPALLWPSGPRVCDLTPLFGQNAVVDCCTFPTSSWPAPQKTSFWGGGRQAGKCLNGHFRGVTHPSPLDRTFGPVSGLGVGHFRRDFWVKNSENHQPARQRATDSAIEAGQIGCPGMRKPGKPQSFRVA